MSPSMTSSSGPGDTVATSPGPALARLMAMVVRPKRARRPISRRVLPKNSAGAGHFDDREVARQLDVVDDVRDDQAVRHPDGHFALREDHPRDAQLLQDAAVQRRHRLGDDVGDAQLLHQRHHQQARLDVLADRDHRHVDVLDAGARAAPARRWRRASPRATPGRPATRTRSSSPSMPITSWPSCDSVVAMAEPNRPRPITANVRLAMEVSLIRSGPCLRGTAAWAGRRPACATAIASVSGPTRPMNIIAIISSLPAGEKKADRLTGAPRLAHRQPDRAERRGGLEQRLAAGSRPSVSSVSQATAFSATKAMSEMKNALATTSAASRRLKMHRVVGAAHRRPQRRHGDR